VKSYDEVLGWCTSAGEALGDPASVVCQLFFRWAGEGEIPKLIKGSPQDRCRICGCTARHGCAEGCYWIERNLCSRCAGEGLRSLICTPTREGCALWISPAHPIPIPIVLGREVTDDAGDLVKFGSERVIPGVWALNPSLNVPGLIHAFVVLYDVPDPAPWEVEKRIVVVSHL
jgi:hypothetical protein